MFQPLVQFY